MWRCVDLSTSQKTAFFVVTAVKTSNPATFEGVSNYSNICYYMTESQDSTLCYVTPHSLYKLVSNFVTIFIAKH
jgi:hypothetical protein